MENYSDKLNAGKEYEQFVLNVLAVCGSCIGPITAFEFRNLGDSCGMEIKYDRVFRKTGNFYIETAEKRRASNPVFLASGIYAPESVCHTYVIGDYDGFVGLSKKTLSAMCQQDICPASGNDTSRGFLLPFDAACVNAEFQYSGDGNATPGTVQLAPFPDWLDVNEQVRRWNALKPIYDAVQENPALSVGDVSKLIRQLRDK